MAGSTVASGGVRAQRSTASGVCSPSPSSRSARAYNLVVRLGVVARKQKVSPARRDELRAALAAAGVKDPVWCEVGKRKKIRKAVRRCIDEHVDLLVACGGDGTVRACLDALLEEEAADRVALAIVPSGTGNLLASHLGVPTNARAAVAVALRGRRRALDVGTINGEHFAVMAGTGLDATMIREADGPLKKKMGRAAYVWSALKNLRHQATGTRIKVDGERWFAGDASCVLVGNIGEILGGIRAFPRAKTGDGLLEVGVVQADTVWGWLRVLARTAAGDAERSPLVQTTRGRKIDIKLARRRPWEVDGGDRPRARRLKIRVEPSAITVCVPAPAPAKKKAPRPRIDRTLEARAGASNGNGRAADPAPATMPPR